MPGKLCPGKASFSFVCSSPWPPSHRGLQTRPLTFAGWTRLKHEKYSRRQKAPAYPSHVHPSHCAHLPETPHSAQLLCPVRGPLASELPHSPRPAWRGPSFRQVCHSAPRPPGSPPALLCVGRGVSLGPPHPRLSPRVLLALCLPAHRLCPFEGGRGHETRAWAACRGAAGGRTHEWQSTGMQKGMEAATLVFKRTLLAEEK